MLVGEPRVEGRGHSLGDYIRPYRRRLAWGVVLLLVTNLLDKAIPWMLEKAVDALQRGSLATVRNFALGVVGVAAFMWLVRTVSRVQVFNVGRDVEYDLRNALMDHLQRLGPSFYRSMPTGEIMSRATNDLGQVRLLVGFGMLSIVNALFAYAGSLALMANISLELTVLSLLPYPLFVVVARGFGSAIYVKSAAAQSAIAKLAERTQESLAGVRVVRSFAVEDAERERFEEANLRAVEVNMSLVVLRGLMFPILMAIGSLGTLIVVWKGGEMILEGEITVGQFAAFSAYLAQLVWPTLAFGYLLSVVQRGRASFARVREIMEVTPEIADLEGALPAGHRGAVTAEGVGLEREGRVILDDVSFAIPAGGSLAIVGPVGAGKSTLAATLPRLISADRGRVSLDGTSVAAIELRSLRRAIGYAQQEPFLFSTTVERNIALGLDDPDAPDAHERVRRAAEEAAILAEIESLPQGFQTLVGERGVQLSGGQKQRIALARALLNEPAVLVLDDPLSAVDTATEEAILRALGRVGAERTLILITHRVVAAATADHILVLSGGRVVERGSHEELLARGGAYAELARRQRLEQELSTL